MKTRTSRISWLRVETGGLLVEGGLANRKQWRAYGRVCVTLRSAWFKAFKRALCATLTNRNYPVTLLSLSFTSFFQFYTLSLLYAFMHALRAWVRFIRFIYFNGVWFSIFLSIERENVNKIKVKLCIYIYI